jgi:hypothetical protein
MLHPTLPLPPPLLPTSLHRLLHNEIQHRAPCFAALPWGEGSERHGWRGVGDAGSLDLKNGVRQKEEERKRRTNENVTRETLDRGLVRSKAMHPVEQGGAFLD